jgi:hypothetical protein
LRVFFSHLLTINALSSPIPPTRWNWVSLICGGLTSQP